MDGIISFFSAIGDAIVAAFEFVISMFQDLVYVIQLLGKIAAGIPGYFSWLPTEAVVMLGLLFAVVVIYKILGREG